MRALLYLSVRYPTTEFRVSFSEIWESVALARKKCAKPVGASASMPGYCEDTALKTHTGMPNRRTWDALQFPIHPNHDSSRYELGIDRGFTVGTVDTKPPHDLWGFVC